MASVAANARMSVGQIYRHFENKEALVDAIVEEQIDVAVRDLTRLASAEGRLCDRLLENFLGSLRRHLDSGFVSLIHEVRAEAARQPKLRALLAGKDAEIARRMADILRTGLPEADDDDLEMRAERICLLFEGALMRLLRRPELDEADLRSLLRPMLEAVVLSSSEPGLKPAALEREIDHNAGDGHRHG